MVDIFMSITIEEVFECLAPMFIYAALLVAGILVCGLINVIFNKKVRNEIIRDIRKGVRTIRKTVRTLSSFF